MPKISTRIIGGIMLAVLAVASLSGCKGCEGNQDAPVNSRDTVPADVINMPNGFSNVAHKCDGSNMVYVIFHGDGGYGSVAVVPNDPRCAGR